MKLLWVVLPAALASEGFDDPDSGLSLLQLRAAVDDDVDPRSSMRYPGSVPGPNPIVTKADCLAKATELGLNTSGVPDLGNTFELSLPFAANNKGCFCYRLCQPGSTASTWRWHAFYGAVTPGQDVTPEEAATPVTGPSVQQRIDQPLHVVNHGCSAEDAALPVPRAPVDEGEAVGDPHITYAGKHRDIDQSDVHH